MTLVVRRKSPKNRFLRPGLTLSPSTARASVGGASDSVCFWEAHALTCASNVASPSPLLPHGGGCAFVAERSSATLIGSDLRANRAAMGGGLLVLGAMLLNQSSIEANVATHGGGLMLEGRAAQVEAEYVHIDANEANSCGGGASVLGGWLRFVGRGSRLANNSAADAGGAVFFESRTAAQLAADALPRMSRVTLSAGVSATYDGEGEWLLLLEENGDVACTPHSRQSSYLREGAHHD